MDLFKSTDRYDWLSSKMDHGDDDDDDVCVCVYDRLITAFAISTLFHLVRSSHMMHTLFFIVTIHLFLWLVMVGLKIWVQTLSFFSFQSLSICRMDWIVLLPIIISFFFLFFVFYFHVFTYLISRSNSVYKYKYIYITPPLLVSLWFTF